MIEALEDYRNDARWDEPVADREPRLLPAGTNSHLGEYADREPDDDIDDSFDKEMELLKEADTRDAFVSMVHQD
ncbi:hypothetical protein [Sinorhizobium sp. BJ1]|uniref:hypothetical protein n=1 Tax=Sinorhizobium sp. BJ1 TaxID=2035455 RepID=UPI000BEA587F|nr:hypothetical protein [Sinorhizobium sp. BJ1]PDT80571.1 hypothetical protein CO676_26585 [Sinorhizobium sp. BJ1]